MNHKAVFFSTDALIAISIIFMTILVAYPLVRHESYNTELSDDMIKSLSSIKIGEIDSAYTRQLISEGKVSNVNQSVLEQIGELYAKEMPEAAALSLYLLSKVSGNENIGVWINNQLIASKGPVPYSSAKDIILSSQIISGIEKGKNLKGYSSRATLSKSKITKYFYFGGYIGDGNISALINTNGTVESVKMEVAINNDFDLYINNIFSGHYENSQSSFNPAIYDISAYLNNFHEGDNVLKFVSPNLYIAGGYIKIVSGNSGYTSLNKKYLPGIEGIINLYDSFYIPGNLDSMSVFLHYKSPYKIFFNIGNKTIFNSSSAAETTFSLDNSQLSSLLEYSSLSKKTIPLRIGLENVSYVVNLTKSVDVFSINDLSGSMEDCILQGTTSYCTYDCCRTSGTGCQGRSCLYTRTCNNQECGACTGSRPLAKNYRIVQQSVCLKTKLDGAKESNNAFIDSILNYSGNRVGLKAYQTSFVSSMSHSLSNNSASLKAKVSSWNANGNTCICCGINEARKDLVANSSADKLKAIVLMSDGQANVACAEQGTGNPKQDAINAACTAHASNITIYTVGFGSDTDVATLQAMATCGGGSYHLANISEIVSVYQQLAQNIIEATYYEQTIISSGNISTKLYPDSYIAFNYAQPQQPYGLAITSQTENLGNEITTGSFMIPDDSEIIEANAISYSGSRWTDRLSILNKSSMLWKSVFSLSEYGPVYSTLGDAYAVNIPLEYLEKGNNTIKITTGLNPLNSSGGSSSDKIIYTLLKPSSGYSKISSSASGCAWTVEFEDSTNSTMNLPSNYSGSDKCCFTSNSISYNENDAIDNAVFDLFSNLDLNKNKKLENKFSEQDMQVISNEVSGIPFAWASEIQIRIWR